MSDDGYTKFEFSEREVIKQYLSECLASRYEFETQGMVNGRKNEFLCGRYIVERLLSNLNINVEKIPVAQNGEPVWPKGVYGSISHDGTLIGAIVSNEPNLNNIGLDIHKELSTAHVKKITKHIDPDFNALYLSLPSKLKLSKTELANLLICAKETVIKVLSKVFSITSFHAIAIGDITMSEGIESCCWFVKATYNDAVEVNVKTQKYGSYYIGVATLENE